jgi:fused signal recognition particle receptor
VSADWSDLFIVGERASVHAPGAARAGENGPDGEGAPDAPSRGGFLRRLRESLGKTREALGGEIQATLSGPLDEDAWEHLEEALIMADVGASTTASVVATLEADAREKGLSGAEALSERLIELLAEAMRAQTPTIDLRAQPTVLMMVGVNGTGKTTTAGKLAWHIGNELGLGVLLAAADTWRAGAGEQLGRWAERAGCEIVGGREGADPGSVAFDAVARARELGADVVIVDTAGRLHTHVDLMAELEKVRRVLGRALPSAPHETLLTIDATTGQNGLRQAQQFAQAAAVSGVVVTKLDGTARGGIAVAIARELALPVKLIGVGEALEDLRPFDADAFARALIAPS